MGSEAIPMDLRLMAAVTGPLKGLNVAGLCREHGVSPKTFYKWRRRFEAEGLAGLEPRPRRPHHSPGRVSVAVEDAVVELRKELHDTGLDAGAATIRYHLAQRRLAYPPPSEATIWRVLVRRGFVVPQPHKRPKTSLRRFEAQFPNECWQIDATEWALADLTLVDIINVLDDHSRLAVESLAAPTASCETAWTAFSRAMERFGVPWRCLSDNGLCFSGRLRGFEVDFEVKLRDAGIKAVTSRPFHPQTCGKVERFQQTLKKWLRAHGPFATLEDLQSALDEFRDYYNHHRPHRGIGRVTPAQRWNATPRVAAPHDPLSGPLTRSQVIVEPTGYARLRLGHLRPEPFQIGIGVEYSGQTADIVVEAGHAAVFINDTLIRYFAIDPTRRYQPSGRKRGGPKRPRLT